MEARRSAETRVCLK